MRFCENCGFRLPNPDARFCRNCGASLVEEEGAPAQQVPPAAPTPPATEAAPPPQQVATPPPQAAETTAPPQVTAPQAPADAAEAKPAGRSKVNLVLGVVVAVQLVAIVVLALLLAFSGGTEAEEVAPEATQDPRLVLAQEYVRALQQEDLDAYIACMDTSQMTKSDIEDYKDLIEEAFDLADIDITDVEFEVTEISESRAEVVTVSGTLEVLSEDDLTTIDFSEEPVTIKMKKSGGEWLISEDPAVELGWEIAF